MRRGSGGHAALQAGGLRLSLSVFLLWQLPHSKICTLPAKACLTGTQSARSAGRQSAAAQRALPSCTARVFCLSAAPGTSRLSLAALERSCPAGPGPCTPAPCTTSAAPHAPPAALGLCPASARSLRRAADATLGRAPAGPRTRTARCTSAASRAAESGSPRPCTR